MMNLASIATAKLSEIKSFVRANNIVPTGDLRRRSTWENAAKSFFAQAAQTVQAKAVEAYNAAKSPKAIAFYRSIIPTTAKFFAIVFLLMVALALTCHDLYKSFRAWLEREEFSLKQPRPILDHLKREIQVWLAFRQFILALWVDTHTTRAKTALSAGIIQPARALQQRIFA